MTAPLGTYLVPAGNVARYLGVSEAWLYEQGDEAGLPCFIDGDIRMYEPYAVMMWDRARRERLEIDDEGAWQ